MQLSDDQATAVAAIEDWLRRWELDPTLAFTGDKRFVFGGLAGTGKTTIVSYLVDTLTDAGRLVRVTAPTGKAAHVLRSKGVDASTLHSLIYRSRFTDRGWKHSLVPEIAADLVIVDEASMLSTQLVNDVESFGIPVLYVGDHGQLEPVDDDPEIMKHCNVKLEKIHRQAEGSSIIQFAHRVRAGLSIGSDAGEDVELASRFCKRHFRTADVVVCGFRATRCRLNHAIRGVRGFEGFDPQVGETVICLANTLIKQGESSGQAIFNGLSAKVLHVHRGRRELRVLTDDDRELLVKYWAPQFGARETANPRVAGANTLWDWGYAITAHKSQGSSYDTIAVLDETHPQWDTARWRYTAATRAVEKLIWVRS